MSTSDEPITFPATSGPALGWCLLFVLAVMIGWFLLEDRSGSTLRVVTGLALLGVLAHAYLIRPRIRCVSGRLDLVNPWTTTAVPLGRIEGVMVRSVTYVRTADARYTAVAVGRSVREMVRPPGETGGMLFGLGPQRGPSHRDANAGLIEERIEGLVRSAPPSREPVTRSVALTQSLLGAALVLVLVLLLVVG